MIVNVLVTGAKGFVGRNLCTVLRRREGVTLFEYDIDSTPAELEAALAQADVILHLAGVNRPQHTEEFITGNVGFTGEIVDRLLALGRTPKLVITSSIQAALDNDYGKSKLGAEEQVARYCASCAAEGVVYRLKNLFGKWCRPNYNAVTATFAYNIAHDLPIQIADPTREVDLTYIDDVVDAFLAELDAPAQPGCRFADPLPSRVIALGDLAALLQAFHGHRQTLHLPDYSDPFVKRLYATYLSYLDDETYGYGLDIKADNRGSLAEFLKSPAIGQLFISRTHPGITRGNHFHQTKTEKFMVVQGEGIIRLRKIDEETVIAFRVRGEDYRVVDIPPGYTHSIENVGDGEMVTLFWSVELFDPNKPDTWFEPVLKTETPA
jgi:UDP-2-acetamido-2,6-beta-L-arabino-hexul-4-ose reductase